MSSLNQAPVTTRFFLPGKALRPYISTFYLTEVRIKEGQLIEDWLHPEWANMRFVRGTLPIGSIGPEESAPAPRFNLVGPTSYATHFESGSMRCWGVGLLPLGWTKFLDLSAEQYADRTTDGEADPALSKFTPLYGKLFDEEIENVETEAAIIEAFFRAQLEDTEPDNPMIARAHNILVDPELETVQEMADRLNVVARTLDRLSRKAFGFPVKLLLRRQRFLRSLAENMLNPSQNWISTLDHNYYDQAHFGRDFQRFMGMSASEYKAKQHPMMNAAVHGRMAAAGAGMQVLHEPESGE